MKWTLFCALALLATAAPAAERLQIRVVEASMEESAADPGLRDVAAFLKENLPYRSFRLVDQTTLALPAPGNRVSLRPGFAVLGKGPQNRLDLTLEKDGRVLLNTVLSLRDGVPVVVGGFPGGRGRLMFVLVAR
ncbi:MAG: hypothetical protein U1E27_05645 [Kiritimatiellia bacterium]|nr:hypothetical protein [Kiritimatiellia bacterium]